MMPPLALESTESGWRVVRWIRIPASGESEIEVQAWRAEFRHRQDAEEFLARMRGS